MLVDTHCHLDFSQFDADRDEIIKEANSRGVNRLINVGANLKSSIASCALAAKYEHIYAAVGVHPHDADSFTNETFEEIARLAKNAKVAAIGEIGLDYFRNLSAQENQERVFKQLIGLAKSLNKPIIVHSRNADNFTLEILKSLMPLKAVIHCFSGDDIFLQQCLDLGFYISFTCNIAYLKAESLRLTAKAVPLDRLMLETDSPYLPPEGKRGRRNDPANVKTVALKLAELKDIELSELEKITTENAFNFFKLK